MLGAARPLTWITDLAPLRGPGDRTATLELKERCRHAADRRRLHADRVPPEHGRGDRRAGAQTRPPQLWTLMRRKSPHELAAMRASACATLQRRDDGDRRRQDARAPASPTAILAGERAANERGAQDVRTLFSLNGGRTLRPFTTTDRRRASIRCRSMSRCGASTTGRKASALLSEQPAGRSSRKAAALLRQALAAIKAGVKRRRRVAGIIARRLEPRPHASGDRACAFASRHRACARRAAAHRSRRRPSRAGEVYSLKVGLTDGADEHAIVSAMVARPRRRHRRALDGIGSARMKRQAEIHVPMTATKRRDAHAVVPRLRAAASRSLDRMRSAATTGGQLAGPALHAGGGSAPTRRARSRRLPARGPMAASPQSGSGTASRREAPSHRHPPPHRAAEIHRRDARAAAAADARLDDREVDRGHGQGRRRHLDHVDHHARRLDRRPRAGPPRRARVQRLCGKARRRLSGPLRHVRGAAAARHRGEPARDRIRPRRAQGRRHLPVHELSRQVARRSGLRAGDGGAQPPQGRGLHASGGAGLLPRPHPRHQRGRDRIRHRHHARDRAAAVHRHRQRAIPTSAGSSPTAAACCRCCTSASCAPATSRRTSRTCRTA